MGARVVDRCEMFRRGQIHSVEIWRDLKPLREIRKKIHHLGVQSNHRVKQVNRENTNNVDLTNVSEGKANGVHQGEFQSDQMLGIKLNYMGSVLVDVSPMDVRAFARTSSTDRCTQQLIGSNSKLSVCS